MLETTALLVLVWECDRAVFQAPFGDHQCKRRRYPAPLCEGIRTMRRTAAESDRLADLLDSRRTIPGLLCRYGAERQDSQA